MNFKILSCLLLQCGFLLPTYAQRMTDNIVIVTLDGLRWQEVFNGADSALLKNNKYTKDSAGTSQKFWNSDLIVRREKLFPFLWTVIQQRGQLYGNRTYGNNVNTANKYKFSYPGYNELFTGYPDTAINSNDKIVNKNINILEFINRQPRYKNRVAAFTSWDVFPYILNRWKSGIYVNADTDLLALDIQKFQLINNIEKLTPRPINVRPDVITYIAAREYMKVYKPKVLYIAFDETDDLAHAGLYDWYLGSANAEDRMIEDLWNYIQSSPGYKNKTTLIITCDHGRGDKIKDNWKDHGEKIEESGEIWIAVIGPDTKHLGEIKSHMQLYQKQLAATLGELLGFTFSTTHPVAKPIVDIYKR